MFCRNCGARLEENQKFCKECGQPLQQDNSQENNVVNETNKAVPTQSKCWTVFSGVGLGLGIGGLATFWWPFVGFMTSICGMIFSVLGRKSVTAKGRATTGLILSIIGLVLGLMFTVTLINDMIDTINSY